MHLPPVVAAKARTSGAGRWLSALPALIDPGGLLAEPEYDLGVLPREDPAELMAGDPRDRARELAASGCSRWET